MNLSDSVSTRSAEAQLSPLIEWFTVAVLVLSTGAFFALAGAVPDGESRPLVLLLWVGAYVASGLGLVDGFLRRGLRVSRTRAAG